ncbi:MAG: hypothetical protein ACREOO_18995 [bacterium]
MPFQPKLYHGFEHETMEAKIRGFLQFSPGERFEQMVGAIELALLAQKSLKEQHARKIPRPAASPARSEN